MSTILHEIEEHWARWLLITSCLYLIYLGIVQRRALKEIRRIALETIETDRKVLANELTKEGLEVEHQATRSHISAELDTIRGNTEVAKANSAYMLKIIKKIATVFGVGVE